MYLGIISYFNEVKIQKEKLLLLHLCSMDQKHITNKKRNFIAYKFVRKYTVKYIVINYHNYVLDFLNYQTHIRKMFDKLTFFFN